VEIPAAVLVFRDGHTEQIRKYVITATTLSTSADYWSSGSWTRKIPIADLNVAETLKLNQQRGTGFSLPSRPGRNHDAALDSASTGLRFPFFLSPSFPRQSGTSGIRQAASRSCHLLSPSHLCTTA
jgi:hypothetical protein